VKEDGERAAAAWRSAPTAVAAVRGRRRGGSRGGGSPAGVPGEREREREGNLTRGPHPGQNRR